MRTGAINIDNHLRLRGLSRYPRRGLSRYPRSRIAYPDENGQADDGQRGLARGWRPEGRIVAERKAPREDEPRYRDHRRPVACRRGNRSQMAGRWSVKLTTDESSDNAPARLECCGGGGLRAAQRGHNQKREGNRSGRARRTSWRHCALLGGGKLDARCHDLRAIIAIRIGAVSQCFFKMNKSLSFNPDWFELFARDGFAVVESIVLPDVAAELVALMRGLLAGGGEAYRDLATPSR
jgi:hypothetical protein